MGVIVHRKDSIRELQKRKTNEQLAAENQALQAKVTALENQLEDTQLALCDVYEAMLGGDQL